MKATFINIDNAVFFLSILPEELIFSSTILIGAIDKEGTACGVLGAKEQKYGKMDKKMINLQFIYVHPDYRRQGAATAMLNLLEQYGRSRECAGIHAKYLVTDDMMSLWSYLESNGFETDEEGFSDMLFRIPYALLEKLIPSRKIKIPEKIVRLKDINRDQKNNFLQYSKHKQLLPIGAYNDTLSSFAFDASEKIKAGVLIIDSPSGDIDFREMLLIGNNPKILGVVLIDVLEKIKKERGEDVYIRIVSDVNSDEKMLNFLNFEDVEKTELVYQLKVI